LNHIKISSIVAAGVLGLASLIAAPSAQASVTFNVANCQAALNGQVFDVPSGTQNFSVTFTAGGCTRTANAGVAPKLAIGTSADPAVGDSVVTFSGQLQLQSTGGPGTDGQIGGSNLGQVITDGSYIIFFKYWPSAGATTSGSFTVRVGGSGGSTTSSEPEPRTETLSLMNEDSGATCVNSSVTGTFGTWVDLPAASDCTPPASKPGATLLGWATFPDFSVEIAQRQIDNGWGAYQTFNAEEQLTGVFIPAGGPTELTAPGKLYPIWSE